MELGVTSFDFVSHFPLELSFLKCEVVCGCGYTPPARIANNIFDGAMLVMS